MDKTDNKTDYDIIIVGAGTAGLSAAIYGVRAGKTVLVLEKTVYGGQIITTSEIENYPAIKNATGYEFATDLYNQAKDLGAVIKTANIYEIRDGKTKTVATKDLNYTCKVVILAIGTKNRPLGLDDEENLIGKGLSYCATCDGAFYKGKDVAVVGGGNTAIEDARFLSNYCTKVYLIHRRNSFKAEKELQNSLNQKDNVELIMNSNVTKLIYDEKLTAIEVTKNDSDNVRKIEVSAIFVAIGQMPNNEPFKCIVDLDEKGYIKAGADCKTSAEGIFAAGDCRTKKVRQLITAAADGAISALAAIEYIDR